MMTVMPRDGEWTVDDLDALPDDGLQYELVDGVLLVSPAPVVLHQRALQAVYRALYAGCPPHLEVFVAPFDFRPSRVTSVQPDVLVVRVDDLGEKNVERGVVLAVEVLSPSTRKKDRLLKHALYAEVGVPSYWVVDPHTPSLHAWQLDAGTGAYGEPTVVTGAEAYETDRPYPVRLTADDLVRARPGTGTSGTGTSGTGTSGTGTSGT